MSYLDSGKCRDCDKVLSKPEPAQNARSTKSQQFLKVRMGSVNNLVEITLGSKVMLLCADCYNEFLKKAPPGFSIKIGVGGVCGGCKKKTVEPIKSQDLASG